MKKSEIRQIIREEILSLAESIDTDQQFRYKSVNEAYKVHAKSKLGIGTKKWELEKFLTGGKSFDYKKGMEIVKKLRRMSSSIDYKLVKESINEVKNIKLSKDGYVKQIKHPMTGKIMKSVKVNGKVYRYNSAYKTYNSVKGNELLYKSDVDNIRYESANEGKKPLIYSLPKRKQDIIYKMLWHRNQPKWHTPGEFEQLIKKYFNNKILPHIADGLKKTKSADDFVKFIRKFNFKEGVTLKEAKKPVEIKLQGITFGKDYQGLSFKNGGVQYYYQKGKGAKHVESDFGKFIVKIGQLVTPATREKVAKKLKESVNEGKVSPSKVQSAVNKVKKQLIKKWKTKGAYENFGQKELRKLDDKFVDISDYSSDMNKIRDILQQFDVWAMNYTGLNESANEIKVGSIYKDKSGNKFKVTKHLHGDQWQLTHTSDKKINFQTDEYSIDKTYKLIKEFSKKGEIMKITKTQLREMIREEIQKLDEGKEKVIAVGPDWVQYHRVADWIEMSLADKKYTDLYLTHATPNQYKEMLKFNKRDNLKPYSKYDKKRKAIHIKLR